ncbi:MAG: hypothetical protein JKY67_02350 [Pseudomonadales bacterium]|nr:hypothetical protein [Pseudomonadales bacterium]
MTDIHISDFNRDVAAILIRLYNQFPRKTTLYVEDIAGYEEPDEFGLHSDRYLSCLGAMLWLSDEGFIRYESVVKQEAIDQAVITNPCFVTLNTVCTKIIEGSIEPDAPISVSQTKSLILNQLRSGLKSGSSSSLESIVHELLQRMSYRSKPINDDL